MPINSPFFVKITFSPIKYIRMIYSTEYVRNVDTLKVLIFAGTNFRGYKFSRDLIFADDQKSAKIKSREILHMTAIRENKVPRNF